MLSTKSKVRMMSVLVILVMLFSFANVSAALAAPQSEVRGQGKVQLGGDDISVSHISVNAWLDDNGVAHGMMNWTGGVTIGAVVPPAYPWHMNVTSIDFSGNTATVCWVVVHSVVPDDIGISDCFDFTDNSATGEPDEILGIPIEAGNIIVR